MAQSSRVVLHRAGLSGHFESMDYFNMPTYAFYQELAVKEFLKISIMFEPDFFRVWRGVNYYYFYNIKKMHAVEFLYIFKFYKILKRVYIIEPSEIFELMDRTTVTLLNTTAVCVSINVLRLNDIFFVYELFLNEGGKNVAPYKRYLNIFTKTLRYWKNCRVFYKSVSRTSYYKKIK